MARLFGEEVIFQQLVHFNVLPKVYMDQFKAGDTTPSVLNCTVFKSPTSSTTVTNFDLGAEGQIIRILGNGNLTVSNNSNIKTNTGANKVLLPNKLYTFVHLDNVWYEAE